MVLPIEDAATTRIRPLSTAIANLQQYESAGQHVSKTAALRRFGGDITSS